MVSVMIIFGNRVMQFGRFLESLQTIRCFKKDSKIRHSFGCHQYQSTKITMSAFLLCVYVTKKLNISCGKIVKNIFFIPILARTPKVLLLRSYYKINASCFITSITFAHHDDAISIVYKDAGLNEVYVKLQIYFNVVFQILVVTLEKYADVENVESINLYDIINGSRNNSSCNTWDSHTLNCSSIDLILQMKWVQYEISNPQRINQNPINEEIRKETKSLKALDSSLLDIL
ncbi:20348_t:CDS:2 [Entrophospora sp. SA101]|nr:20348_t:CDS:2 [Entrophospora sp. SA101]